MKEHGTPSYKYNKLGKTYAERLEDAYKRGQITKEQKQMGEDAYKANRYNAGHVKSAPPQKSYLSRNNYK